MIFQRRQPQQHLDLCRRSARAGGVRVRHQPGRRAAGRRKHLELRRSTRCGRSPTTPTAARSSTATISRAGCSRSSATASGYYLLGYNSSQAPTDGKFHKIDVRRHAQGRRGPRAQGLLGLHRRGRGARDGAAEARAPPGGHARAGDARRAAARPPGALLDRHGARRGRQVARHVRVGADRAGAGRAPAVATKATPRRRR